MTMQSTRDNGRDESSLDNVVSCKFYNRRTHGLSAEAERELLANNNTLSASPSTGSVMVVAGPEMAACWGVGGVADGANGNGVGQRQARPICSVRTTNRTGRDPSVPSLDSLSAFLSARLKDSEGASRGRFCYSCELLVTPILPNLTGPVAAPIYFNLLF